jgi:glycosyltransferase involved in cell wall biosynthesis
LLNTSILKGKIIFVYLGNIGISQGINTLMNLMEALKDNSEIGFLIVGRGSELNRLDHFIRQHKILNSQIYPELRPAEVPDLLRHCDVGMVFLDPRHKMHNIPGKFSSYLQSGLPIFAVVNSGNDLLEVIPRYRVGVVDEGKDLNSLVEKAISISKQVRIDADIHLRCKALAKSLLNPNVAALQIKTALLINS